MLFSAVWQLRSKCCYTYPWLPRFFALELPRWWFDARKAHSSQKNKIQMRNNEKTGTNVFLQPHNLHNIVYLILSTFEHKNHRF